MHHKYAIVFNKATGNTYTWSAKRFATHLREEDAKHLEENPSYKRPADFVRKNYELYSSIDANPVVFKNAHTKLGNEIKIAEHFAYASGYGQEDHLYERNEKKASTSIKKAVESGKYFLLSINTDTSHRPLNFRQMRGQNGTTLEKWMDRKRGNYISVSVRSAEETIDKLKNLHKHGLPRDQFKHRVFALYRGGILPFENFYLGSSPKKLQPLFDQVHDLKTGVPMKYGTRALSFPRLIKFRPSKDTLKYPNKGYPSGNVIEDPESNKTSYSQLIFADKDVRETDAYKTLIDDIVDRNKDVFILSSASVTVPRPKRTTQGKLWEQLRWNIDDIDAQIFVRTKDGFNAASGNGSSGQGKAPANDAGKSAAPSSSSEKKSAGESYMGFNNQYLIFPPQQPRFGFNG